MKAIAFYTLYCFLWMITLLPLKVQFLFSDLVYLILYYLIGYRKEVVRQNLKNSFPEKSASGIKELEKKFYRHFCDSFIEWTYGIHASPEKMKKRFAFENPEVLNQLYDEGKSVVAVVGHYANWEWLSILPCYIKHKVWAIHKPLKNQRFNNFINGLRSKFGVNMVEMTGTYRTLLKEERSGTKTLTYFLSDQSPVRTKISYYTNFLGQDTPVFLGAEQIAKKLGMAVVFFNIRKLGRGKYSLRAEVLFKDASSTEPYEITNSHVRALERQIEEDPAWWLWSHKRWKYSRENLKKMGY